MGFTASLPTKYNPNSYIGIDADEDVVKLLKEKFTENNVTIVQETHQTPLCWIIAKTRFLRGNVNDAC